MQAKAILRAEEHRTFAPPRGPWVMRQTWEELLFAHWPLPVEALRSLVPSALALDTYDGHAWLGIVPFRMRDVRPRLVPSLPWLSAFPEMNVRTYVTAGDKPGVYFFSLDAGNSLAVAVARRLFYLPYFNAHFQISRESSRSSRPWDTISYSCQRPDRRSPLAGSAPAAFSARYSPIGPVFASQPGSLEAFLTERYCLYSVSPRGMLYRGEIHHRRWPLQIAEADISCNTLTQADGLPPLPNTLPLLHYAAHLEVLIWPITKVDA